MSKSQAQRSVSRNPRTRRRSPGWVPDQHGAWFMVTVPAITPRRHVLVPRRLIAHADREHNKESRSDERKHELGYMKSM